MTRWTLKYFLLSTWLILCGDGFESVQGTRIRRHYPDVVPLMSLFTGGPFERESRILEQERDAYGESIECFCEVIVNGEHNPRGEEAVCGLNNFQRRIRCPYNSGCQTARANVQGFVSAVKTCGYDTRQIGCHFHKEKAELVGTVDVERCYCNGYLCNYASRDSGLPCPFIIFGGILTYILSTFIGSD